MKNALVTGANGFVGSRLCRELCEHGYTVTALHRKDSNLAGLAGLPVKKVVGDVTDRASLEAAADGADVVFHIAALFREAKFPDSVYWEANFEGTRNMLDVAVAKKVDRFIFCSTTGVHGHIYNPPADETAGYAPNDVYQRSKCEAEKLTLSYFREGKIKGAVIRPTMIWGPGDKRIFKLFKGIATRKLPLIGDGKTLFHWVLVDDLVRGFRLAAENPASNGQVYLIGGDRIVTIRETFEAIAAALNRKLLPIRIPAWPLKIIGAVVESICLPFGWEPPIYRRRVDFFTKSRAFSCKKAERELGYHAAQSFEEEVALLVNWYRKAGWLN